MICRTLPFRLLMMLMLAGAGNAVTAQEADLPYPEIPRLRVLDFKVLTDSPLKLDEARTGQITGLIRDATLPVLQEALTTRKVTSEELTLYFLDRIQRYDGVLRSYIEINPACLNEARAADRQRAEGTKRGPLHGIPLNLKDNIGTAAPLHTTAGAEILLNHSPAEDASLVSALREAGAVILGKASLSELAGVLTTDPAGYNAVSGIGRNPYGKQLPVSGSSSGSAISTSAFLTMLSVGTETSGSLISPGSMNGVVAMKPTHGLVSGGGIVPLIRFQDCAGPVTRNVTDAAILLAGIDQATVDYTTGLSLSALEGVAVGVLREAMIGPKRAGSRKEWLDRIDDGLAKAKAAPRDVKLEGQVFLTPVVLAGLSHETMGYLRNAGAPVLSLTDLRNYNRTRPEIRIPHGQNMIDLGIRVVDSLFAQNRIREEQIDDTYETMARKAQNGAAALLSQAFKEGKVDLLVSLGNQHSEYYATAGYPAITVPLGLNKQGAPHGVTFIARRGEDARLLAYAFAFEQATHYRINPAEIP